MGNAAAELVFESSVIVRKSPSPALLGPLPSGQGGRCRRHRGRLLLLTGIFGGPLASRITGHPQNQTYSSRWKTSSASRRGRTATSGSEPTRRAATCSCGDVRRAHLADRRHRSDRDRRASSDSSWPARGLLRRLDRHRPLTHRRRACSVTSDPDRRRHRRGVQPRRTAVLPACCNPGCRS